MTIIRKIKGNPFVSRSPIPTQPSRARRMYLQGFCVCHMQALQRDIQKALGVKATVNSGGAIYIKGLVVEPVMQFLKDKGF